MKIWIDNSSGIIPYCCGIVMSASLPSDQYINFHAASTTLLPPKYRLKALQKPTSLPIDPPYNPQHVRTIHQTRQNPRVLHPLVPPINSRTRRIHPSRLRSLRNFLFRPSKRVQRRCWPSLHLLFPQFPRRRWKPTTFRSTHAQSPRCRQRRKSPFDKPNAQYPVLSWRKTGSGRRGSGGG